MSNEKRLIDANDFDLRVSQKKMTEVFPNWKELPVEVQDAVCKHAQHLHMLLETQHTVDAVEVVRCKDCVSYCATKCVDGFGWCVLYDKGKMDSDFCSFGKRRDA